MIRKLLPARTKRKIRLIQRRFADRKSGVIKEFANKSPLTFNNNGVLVTRIEQPIFYNPLAANKVFNIQLAIDEIKQVIIHPNHVFSFWHIVGDPTTAKGYKTGRNIIGDSLQEDIGGGLCQVSGMIYHLALTAGMEIVERYNHTLDLYEEDKRYTPLGADATVVYGYKDIRFRNNTKTPVRLEFEVSQTNFIGTFYAQEKIPICELKFERENFDKYRTIKTYRSCNNQEEFINLSRYLL